MSDTTDELREEAAADDARSAELADDNPMYSEYRRHFASGNPNEDRPMTATKGIQSEIDTLAKGYQPLAEYTSISGGWRPLTESEKESNADAKAHVEDCLKAAGFRGFPAGTSGDSRWFSADSLAIINVDDATIGVSVLRGSGIDVEYANHRLDGTYDALPLAEKFRLSGSPGTIESWLLDFDRCGMKRPS